MRKRQTRLEVFLNKNKLNGQQIAVILPIFCFMIFLDLLPCHAILAIVTATLQMIIIGNRTKTAQTRIGFVEHSLLVLIGTSSVQHTKYNSAVAKYFFQILLCLINSSNDFYQLKRVAFTANFYYFFNFLVVSNNNNFAFLKCFFLQSKWSFFCNY